MVFSSIAAPAATSVGSTFASIEPENRLQVTGEASAGAGSLYLLRWNPTLEEWRVYMEDRPIAVNSAALGGFFSAAYPFPKGEESFCLYDPAAAITATASAAQTGSPLFATPTGITISGGTQVGAFAAATNQTLDLEKLDLRMEPGDVLAVALQTASSTATTNVSLNWHEE